jgi:hypothetical protein
MRRLPLVMQTAYADLLDKTEDAALMNAALAPGNFVSKTVKGRIYWYHQYSDEQGKRRQSYIGPQTPKLLARIENFRDLKQAERERRDIVRMLTRGGMAAPPPDVGKALLSMSQAGVFRLRAVLVGTLAYQIYGPMLGVKLGSSAVLTQDIDVAQFRSISVAVDDSLSAPLTEELQRTTHKNIVPISAPSHETRPVSYSIGGLRIDILTPMQGPDDETPLELPALQVAAFPLRFLDFLIYEEVPAVALYGPGIAVSVPDPARFALHKLILAERRNRLAPAKARKDLEQAQQLLQILLEDRPQDIQALWEELSARGIKWTELARSSINRMKIKPLKDQLLYLSK